MGRTTTERAKTEALKINKDLAELLKACKENDRREMASTLMPGQTMPLQPFYNGFYIQKNRENYRKQASAYGDQLRQIAADLRADVVDDRGTAPSQDNINALQVLRGMEHPQADAISATLQMHGNNYLTYAAICEIAHKNGVMVTQRHPTEYTEALAETIENRAQNAQTMPESSFTPGASALFDSMLQE